MRRRVAIAVTLLSTRLRPDPTWPALREAVRDNRWDLRTRVSRGFLQPRSTKILPYLKDKVVVGILKRAVSDVPITV
jgi:hypothetical protein